MGWETIVPILIGGLMGQQGAREQARAIQQANVQNRPQFFGPGLPYARRMLGDAESLYGEQGFAPTTNPLELMGRRSQLGYAEGALPGLIGAAQGSWLQGLNPALNPYVGSMIQAAQNDLIQDYQRYTLPAIADQSQYTGGYGGSRQGVAQGIASEGLLEALGDVSTRMLGQAYGQGLQQQRAAWGAMPNMLQAGMMPGGAQQDIGAMYRQDLTQPAQNLIGYSGLISPYVGRVGGAPAQPVPSTTAGLATGAGAGLGWYNQNRGWIDPMFQPSAPVTPVPQSPSGWANYAAQAAGW